MSDWFQHDWCSSFVLALGHFLWQGTLIALLFGFVNRLPKSAAVRYWLSLLSLLLMALCPVATFAWIMEPADSVSEATSIVEPAYELNPNTSHEFPDLRIRAASASSFDTTVEQDRWQQFSPVLASIYLGGVALMLLRLAIGLWGGRRLRGQSTLVADVTLLSALQRQASALGLKLRPILAYCEHVTVPTVMGVLRPMILLPLSIVNALSPEQIEAILAHELAHLRRYDHVMNLLQRVIESLLFFHPAIWWVSQRVRAERELCCDDLVVACGAVPLDYAASLLRVAELSWEAERQRGPVQPRFFTAVSLFATGERQSTLRQRIARLVGEATAPTLRLSLRALTASAVVLLIGMAILIQLGVSMNQVPALTASDEPEVAYPGIEFRIAASEADRNADGVVWLPIVEPRIPVPDGESGANVPVEEKRNDQWHGLVWETTARAMLADGTWQIKQCDVVPSQFSTGLRKEFHIQIELDAAGGEQIRLLTSTHLNQALAIVVDGTIISAPVIRDAISNKMLIAGGYNEETATKLADAIRKGRAKQEVETVTGTVVSPDGQSIAGIEVRGFQGAAKTPRQLERTFRTDANGQFRVPKVRHEVNHRLTLVARQENGHLGWFGFAPHEPSAVSPKPEDGSFQLMVLPMSRIVRGRVLDHLGQPLAQASVRIESLDHAVNSRVDNLIVQNLSDEPLLEGAVTGEDGTFTLRLPQETSASLSVTHPDRMTEWIHVPIDEGSVALLNFAEGRAMPILIHVPKGEVKVADVKLSKAAKVVGKVVDSRTGIPISGVAIGLRMGNHPKSRLLHWPGGPVTGDDAPVEVAVFIGSIATTDANGEYNISDVRVGEYTIEFTKGVDPELAAPDITNVVLQSGDTFHADFELTAGKHLTGRVIDDETGGPVPGCKVTYRGHSHNGSTRIETTSNAQGEFQFLVPPGRCRVDAIADRFPAEESIRNLDVLDDGTPAFVVLKVGASSRPVPDDLESFEK